MVGIVGFLMENGKPEAILLQANGDITYGIAHYIKRLYGDFPADERKLFTNPAKIMYVIGKNFDEKYIGAIIGKTRFILFKSYVSADIYNIRTEKFEGEVKLEWR